jgi:hypothetical protein
MAAGKAHVIAEPVLIIESLFYLASSVGWSA